jgi:hypothetical protein
MRLTLRVELFVVPVLVFASAFGGNKAVIYAGDCRWEKSMGGSIDQP